MECIFYLDQAGLHKLVSAESILSYITKMNITPLLKYVRYYQNLFGTVRAMYFFFVLIIVFLNCRCLANDLEQVERWRKYDKVYSSSIYASGVRNSIAPPILRQEKNTKEESYLWQMTQKNDNKCVLLRAVSSEQPSQDIGISPQRISFFKDSKQILRRETTLDSSVPQDEFLTSKNITNNVLHTLSSESDVLSLHMDMFLFALGRGFTPKLNVIDDSSVTNFQHNGEELYSLKSSGYYLSSDGIWEIQFVPSLAYMVRSARFLRHGNTALEIETYGTNIHDDCIFPKKAEMRIYITPQKHILHKFVISDAKLKYDVKLYEFVQNDVNENLMDGSTLIDETSGETHVTLAGSPNVFNGEISHGRFYRFLFIVVVNVTGIALILYLYFRNHRKK
jgi:hypothetical protein